MLRVSCFVLFNVPQFIDIEDKLVGPLTAKQLGWLGAAGVIGLVLWATLDFSAFLIGMAIDLMIFGSLAFYKPYNQPLIQFIFSSIYFLFRPRVYVWRRNYDNIKTVSKKPVEKKGPAVSERKVIDSGKIKEISKILDNKE